MQENIDNNKPVVAVAGATGFIGRALLPALKSHCRLICLTRSAVNEEDSACGLDVSWRQCDLFSLNDIEQVLCGADYAYYLVHSMMPSARLTQGSFQDMDLILADNFARAAALTGVKQIIYLGGLVPRDQGKLSRHLDSRLEVEKTLGSYGVPVTAIRAGIIVGADGSSFSIITHLVERFKIMVLPRLMLSLTHPIALSDIIKILCYCLGRKETYNRSFDVGGPDVMTYQDMIKQTAEVMGHKPRIFTVPTILPFLTSWFLSFFMKAPKALVIPLVESLQHDMVAENRVLQKQMNLTGISFKQAVRMALIKEQSDAAAIKPPKVKKNQSPEKKVPNVRSVQRLPLPPGKDAHWVARHYSQWLPSFFKGLVKVKVDGDGSCHFYFSFMKNKSLLDLSFSEDRSFNDRPIYYITGGLMAHLNRLPHPGRLEFRGVLQNKYTLVAIHDYVPTLPWFIYNLTQAQLHLWVMHNFRRHLLLNEFTGKLREWEGQEEGF